MKLISYLVLLLGIMQAHYTQGGENLVINGDFNTHWSYGWERKYLNESSKRKINLRVENTIFPTNSNNNVLHVIFKGGGNARVRQSIRLPEGRDIRRLVLSMDLKIITKLGGGLGGGDFYALESFIGISLNDANSNSLGIIRLANDTKDHFCGSNMLGTCQIPDDSGTRCTIPVNGDFQNIKMNIGTKILDCLPAVNSQDVKEIEIASQVKSRNQFNIIEFFLDNVILYYK